MTFQKKRAGGRAFLRPPGRKSGEQKTARQGVRRARKMVQGESAAACGKAALCAPFRRRSRSARFAAGALASVKLFRRRVFAHKAFSLSGVYSQKCVNRISKNARLWAYAADVENLSFQQYPYFFQ